MTDIEISKAMALSIGYLPEHVRMVDWGNGPFVQVLYDGSWCGFDYRQPHTIFQIAERYNCFPSREYNNYSMVPYWVAGKGIFSATAETAAKAIALAVIRGAK